MMLSEFLDDQIFDEQINIYLDNNLIMSGISSRSIHNDPQFNTIKSCVITLVDRHYMEINIYVSM